MSEKKTVGRNMAKKEHERMTKCCEWINKIQKETMQKKFEKKLKIMFQ